jgi:hypothetical protein
LGIRINYLSSGRSPIPYQFTRMVIKLTVAIIKVYSCYQLHIKLGPPPLKVKSIHTELPGIISKSKI